MINLAINNLDISTLLSYGAIGLSCILALSSYFLLRKEQNKEIPNRQMLNSIYFFMIFSLLLSIGSFIKESKEMEVNSLKESNTAKLKSARSILEDLLNDKSGKINRLSELNFNDSSSYHQTLSYIIEDLHGLDSTITNIISDLDVK
tara:strand:+ start:742 stop:1182 length:441 start_codon:yes stop_codon:yes gene_type:complete